MQKELVMKQKNWLLKHIFSSLLFDFNYDAKDFWWSHSNAWNKDVKVNFRFIKIFLANTIATFLNLAIILICAPVMDWYRHDGFSSLKFSIWAAIALSLFLSLINYSNVVDLIVKKDKAPDK